MAELPEGEKLLTSELVWGFTDLGRAHGSSPLIFSLFSGRVRRVQVTTGSGAGAVKSGLLLLPR